MREFARQSLADERWWPARLLAAVVLPAVLYGLLDPERFGLTPNSLDPFFYTGFGINFDDIIREIGANYYFTSRWSVYLPSRLFSSTFGPSLGRIVLRWVIAAGILLSLWHVGRQWRWNRATELTIGIIALTTPMFARAFMTDYVEWLIVGLGIVLICQCLEPKVTLARGVAIGVLAALVVIANPLAVTVTIAPIAFCIGNHYFVERDIKATALRAGVLLSAGCGTVLFGWVLFRVRYDMPNVYQPTLAFLRQNREYSDPLKSPKLTWMGTFTWLYVPPLLLAASLVVPATRQFLRSNRVASAAMCLLAAQYIFQWLDQFGRDGNGLEISYYWSFIVPALTVATAVFLGSLTLTWRSSAVLLASWTLILVQPRPADLDLPAGWLFVVVVVFLLGVVTAIAVRRPVIAGALVVCAALAFQVAAPRYDPSGFHFFNASPRYDEIYFNADSSSDQQFSEAIWLDQMLDTLPNDAGISFLPQGFAVGADGAAANVIGIFGAHVTGKWLKTGSDGLATTDTINQLDSGTVPLVAVYGPPDFVETTVASMTELRPETRIVLDATHDGGLDYRLVVVEFIPPDYDDFTWQATALPAQTGQDVDGVRTARPERDMPGILVYGPGATLADQRYRATLEYASADEGEATGEVAGFEVAVLGEPVGRASIVGSDGERTTATIDFTAAAGPGWEFRTTWFGEYPLDVYSVRIERLD